MQEERKSDKDEEEGIFLCGLKEFLKTISALRAEICRTRVSGSHSTAAARDWWPSSRSRRLINTLEECLTPSCSSQKPHAAVCTDGRIKLQGKIAHDFNNWPGL